MLGMNILVNTIKALVISIISILFVALMSPLVLYKWIIKFFAKKCHPDFGKMLDPISTSFANAEDWMGYNVMLVSRIAGEMDYHRLLELINTRQVQMKNDEGELVFPELQQYVTTWFGHHFFVQEKHFDIHDHVVEYVPEKPLLEDAIFELEQNLLNKTFNPKQSFWKFYLINGGMNQEGPFFMLILVVNHILGDGISIFHNLIGRLWDPQESFEPSAFRQHTKPHQHQFNSLAEVIQIPIDLWSHIMRDPEDHIWHVDPKLRSLRRVFTKSGLVENSVVKDLSRHFGTSFSGAVLAGVTGGIRAYLIEKCFCIPSVISCMVPLPERKPHPDGLSNSYAYLNFNFPVGIPDDETRFSMCEKMFQEKKESSLIVTGNYFLSLMSNLGKFTPRFDTCGLDLSLLPGPVSPVYLDGNEVLEVGPCLFHGRNVETLSILLTSYNGKFRLTLSCDEYFIKTNKEAKLLMNKLIQYLCLDQYVSSMHNKK